MHCKAFHRHGTFSQITATLTLPRFTPKVCYPVPASRLVLPARVHLFALESERADLPRICVRCGEWSCSGGRGIGHYAWSRKGRSTHVEALMSKHLCRMPSVQSICID